MGRYLKIAFESSPLNLINIAMTSSTRPRVPKRSIKEPKPYYLEILNNDELDELAEYMDIMYQHKIIRPKVFKGSDIVDMDSWSNFGVTANELVESMKKLAIFASKPIIPDYDCTELDSIKI